jgi:hypothetical protein
MIPLPTPREPDPIRGTRPAPEAYAVVRVVRHRLALARQIQSLTSQLAASDATLDEHVREWAARIAVFEGRLAKATEQARNEAEGRT